MALTPSTLWREAMAAFEDLMERDPESRRVELAAMEAARPDLHRHVMTLLRNDELLQTKDFLVGSGADLAMRADKRLAPGDQLGPFRLERELGRGGMGEVWLARRADGVFEAPVALKVLHTHLAASDVRGRFVREGRILGQLSHPHIARLLDAGVTSYGQLYLAIEYVEGAYIDRWCEQQGLGTAARVRLFLQVCDAVAHAHGHLIVHRDLKPSNTLVTPQGQVKLLDFGIAKLVETEAGQAETELTRLGGRVLTPEYAAPEQISGMAVTVATDVYSLGVMLYQLLSGRRPYGKPGQSLSELEHEVLTVEPASLTRAVPTKRLRAALSGDLDTIVLKALKKKPGDRYATVAALAEDLQRWLDHRPVLAQRDSLAYRTNRFVRRYRLLVGAATAIIVALSIGLGIAIHQANVATEARHAAHARRLQADDLIGFMLGDLTEQLTQAGRLDALESTVAKATRYLDSEDTTQDRQTLAQRASALSAIGLIRFVQGQFAEGSRVAAEAVRLARLYQASHPGPAADLLLVKALYAHAAVRGSLGDSQMSFSLSQDGLHLARALHHRDRSDAMIATTLANLAAQSAWGANRLNSKAAASLLRECTDAVAALVETPHATPSLSRSYIECLSTQLQFLRRADDATRFITVAQQTGQRYPRDMQLLADIQRGLANAGSVLILTRRYDEGSTAIDAAILSGRRLKVVEPGNSYWAFGLAAALSWKQVLETQRARWDDADQAGAEAIAILETLLREETKGGIYRRLLLSVYADRAALAMKRGAGRDAANRFLEAGLKYYRDGDKSAAVIASVMSLRLRQWLYNYEEADTSSLLNVIRDLRAQMDEAGYQNPSGDELRAEADYMEGRIEDADKLLIERRSTDSGLSPDFEEFREAACSIRLKNGGVPCTAIGS